MRILVTGGHGFVGSALTKALNKRYPHAQVFAPSFRELNLLDGNATQSYIDVNRPDCVFHLAARLGGVGLVSGKPLAFLENNLQINLNILSAVNRTSGEGVRELLLSNQVAATRGTHPCRTLRNRCGGVIPKTLMVSASWFYWNSSAIAA